MVVFLGASKESEDDEVMQQSSENVSNIENKQRKELEEPKMKDK